jgi:hypothetical membrane protein
MAHSGGTRRQLHLVGRLAVWSGVVAPVLALGCVVLSTALATPAEFTWAGNALSDLGRPEASTFWLFNGGLIAGGTVGIPFTLLLWRRARNRLERLAAFTFLLSVVGLALVGVFHLPRDPHGLVALCFFVGGPVTHSLYGVGLIRRGERALGRVSVGFGAVHVLAWGGWLGYVAMTGSSDFFAVPELVAAVAFGCWAVAVAGRFRQENTAV